MNMEAKIWYASALELGKTTIPQVELVVSSMMAYSSELFLKTILLIRNDRFIQTHNLIKLFESVPSGLQVIIEKNVKFSFSSLYNFFTGEIIYHPTNFMDVLESFSNDFINKRNIHEELMAIESFKKKGKGRGYIINHVDDLSNFCNALMDCAKNLIDVDINKIS